MFLPDAPVAKVFLFPLLTNFFLTPSKTKNVPVGTF